MPTITPFLWFDGKVAQAIAFYTSVFRRSKVRDVCRGPRGKVMSATLVLEGQELTLFDGGPHFEFTPAISLFVSCRTQKETDRLWDALSRGGKKGRCGWLTDRFGLSWQIIPTVLGELLQDEDQEKAGRALQAMLGMTKLDIRALRRAHAGR